MIHPKAEQGAHTMGHAIAVSLQRDQEFFHSMKNMAAIALADLALQNDPAKATERNAAEIAYAVAKGKCDAVEYVLSSIGDTYKRRKIFDAYLTAAPAHAEACSDKERT